MEFRETLINSILRFSKDIHYSILTGSPLPSFLEFGTPIMDERNRLIVIANERLTRIEELEADKELLINTIRNDEEAMSNMRDYIGELISG